MGYLTSTFPSSLGSQLTKHTWSVDKPACRVVIVHGFGEHAMRYQHLADKLNQQSMDVVCYDQIGHGVSEGIRAYVPTFDVYLDDLSIILGQFQDSIPTFLFGHSMGGLIVTRYVSERGGDNLEGLITSGALLKMPPVNGLLKFLLPIMSYLFPKLPTQELEKKYVTRSEDILDAYINDPLVYQKGVRARMAAEMYRSTNLVQTNFEKITIPLLIMHGEADKLTDPVGSKQMHENARTSDNTLKIYPGLFHELINEPERADVMIDIQSWILNRL